MEPAKATSSGVKNLRAMFENPEASPSADRGRIPSNDPNGDSIRPLSRVRTNFVTVEPKATPTRSQVNAPPEARIENRDRRASFSLSEENDHEALADIHRTISKEELRRERSKDVQETIPEQALETSATPTPAIGTPKLAATTPDTQRLNRIRKEAALMGANGKLDLESSAAKSTPTSKPGVRRQQATPGANRDQVAATPGEPNARRVSLPGDPTLPQNRPSLSSGYAPVSPQAQEVLPKNNGVVSGTPSQAAVGKHPPATPRNGIVSRTKVNGDDSKLTTNGSPVPKSRPQTAASTRTPAPKTPGMTPKQDPKQSSGSTIKSARSPAPTNPPASIRSVKPAASSPNLRSAAKEPLKKQDQRKQSPSDPEPLPSAAATTKPSTGRPSTGSTTSQGASGTGFVKPPPRAPTQPVKLPSRLLAQTASSAAKLDGSNGADSMSKSATLPSRSGRDSRANNHTHATAGRTASRASNNTAGQAQSKVSKSTGTLPRSSTKTPSFASSTAASSSSSNANAKSKPSTTSNTSSSNNHGPASFKSSIGPPPAKKDAKPRTSGGAVKPPDEGFLARMMRPTASSRSKVLGGGEEGEKKTVKARVASASGVKRPITTGTAGTAEVAEGKGSEVQSELPAEEGEKLVREDAPETGWLPPEKEA